MLTLCAQGQRRFCALLHPHGTSETQAPSPPVNSVSPTTQKQKARWRVAARLLDKYKSMNRKLDTRVTGPLIRQILFWKNVHKYSHRHTLTGSSKPFLAQMTCIACHHHAQLPLPSDMRARSFTRFAKIIMIVIINSNNKSSSSTANGQSELSGPHSRREGLPSPASHHSKSLLCTDTGASKEELSPVTSERKGQ